MSKRDKLLLLNDMLQSAINIQDWTSEISYHEFINDAKTIDAVVRNFEIIGEAANRIDDDTKLEHPEIDWRRLRGFRNRIVHDYFGIDYEIVWSIIKDNINDLINHLSEITSKYK